MIATTATTAPTTAGPVHGFERDGVIHFRGIPYAADTGGANRFRPPQPVAPWAGVRDATKFGLIAPQTPSELEVMLGAPRWPAGEDCLAVNVWTPAVDDRRRPVLFWIHGGAFHAGFGSMLWYDGSALARRGDVVVVSCNYRLGALGFLHLGDLFGDEFAGSGANGILDQAAALRWVSDNISAFGGDPEQVTIFGESAGAKSVATLMALPAAGGLFRGAITQSLPGRTGLRPESAAVVTAAMLAELGLGPAGAEAILEVPLEAILDAQQRVIAARLTRASTDLIEAAVLTFEPVVDGTVLPRNPIDAMADGAAAGVRLIAGTTAEEWRMFGLIEREAGGIDAAQLEQRVQRLFGEAAPHALSVYGRARPEAAPMDLWEAVATDWMFRIPTIRLAEAHSRHEPTWTFRFDYASTAWGGMLGAGHAVDVPFPFDNLDRKGVEMFIGPIDDGARGLARAMSGAWLAFARDRDPNHDGLPAWPAYDRARRATMVLDRERQVLDDPDPDERALWEGVL